METEATLAHESQYHTAFNLKLNNLRGDYVYMYIYTSNNISP